MEILNIDLVEMEIALNAAYNIIDKSNPVSTFNNVLFNKDGLFAVNNFCSLNYRFKNNIEEAFGVSPDIFSIVKNTGNNYDMIVKENVLEIDAENVKAELTLTNDVFNEDIPEFKDEDFFETSEFKPLPINFISCLQRVKPYTQKVRDAARTENYSFIIDKDKVYATNNKVMIFATLDGEMERCLIPAETLKILTIIDPEEYQIQDNFILFKTGDIIFSIKRTEETQFTDIILKFFDDNMPDDDNKFKVQGDFKQVLENVSVFLPGSKFGDGIVFTPDKDRLLLSTQNNRGKIQGELFCPKGEFPESINEFCLSYKFLKPVAGTCEYFIETKTFVVFVEETVSTIIMKIVE